MRTILTALAATGLLSAAGPALAQDVAAGEKVFKKCKACHRVGDDAKNGVGPILNGVIGRPAGSVDGYKYGKGMQQAGAAGLVWNEELILEYITDPKVFLRTYLDDPKAKAKMVFKFKKEQDRMDVLAYVKTFSPDAEASAAD
ncbi:MAG: cytochrome c family protein [Hyphomicrobiales bacterium]|nr:cytochrome c family protein [Hyphomicrobiales bacterium]MCP4998247.1 cytochrome c family protein [Hyphomicrobiales bacterium]